MTKEQLDALRIVLDLARANALDPYDKETRYEDELYATAVQHQESLALVELMLQERAEPPEDIRCRYCGKPDEAGDCGCADDGS